MKRLTCEMCGASDLIKQEGVFICQHCGAKYSVEEAKKIMIEGNVDVSGSTVTIDASGELANLYQIARRARDDNNSENAAKYYDMILIKDPTSWEAAFYVVYFKAMECKIAQIRSAANNVANCEGSVLELIRDHVLENEQLSAVHEVVYRSILIASMLSVGAANHYSGISVDIKSNYTQEYVDNVCAARDILYTCGNEIERLFEGREDIIKLTAVEAWKAGIGIHQGILTNLMNKDAENQVTQSYAEKIEKYDPEYQKEYEIKYMRPQFISEIKDMKEKLWRDLLMCFLHCLCLVFGIIIEIDIGISVYNYGFENDEEIYIGVIGLTIILIAIVNIICSLRRVNRAKGKLAAHKEKVKQIEAKYETMEGQTEQHEDGVIDQN